MTTIKSRPASGFTLEDSIAQKTRLLIKPFQQPDTPTLHSWLQSALGSDSVSIQTYDVISLLYLNALYSLNFSEATIARWRRYIHREWLAPSYPQRTNYRLLLRPRWYARDYWIVPRDSQLPFPPPIWQQLLCWCLLLKWERLWISPETWATQSINEFAFEDYRRDGYLHRSW